MCRKCNCKTKKAREIIRRALKSIVKQMEEEKRRNL